MTFDRKTKKDAYFIYKAYLSSDPFVHLCGRRYVHRTESQTEIKVYSNQPRVTLFVDGKEFAAQDGDKIFKFIVPISGTHEIKAVHRLHDNHEGRQTRPDLPRRGASRKLVR